MHDKFINRQITLIREAYKDTDVDPAPEIALCENFRAFSKRDHAGGLHSFLTAVGTLLRAFADGADGVDLDTGQVVNEVALRHHLLEVIHERLCCEDPRPEGQDEPPPPKHKQH